MEIRQMLVDPDKYGLKCPFEMDAQDITAHNTANKASADAEIQYMISNNSDTSYHFAVDESEAVQGLPLNRNGWHAGDGNYGFGNRNTIGVEICRSTSDNEAPFDKSEENGAILIAQMLDERGWDIGHLKKHQDWSGKYCPHKTLDRGWERFVSMVESHMGANDEPYTEPVPHESKDMDLSRRVVRADYVRELGRDADDEGLENYATAFANGIGEQTIINGMVNSDEWSIKFIVDCYRSFMGRGADEDGLKNWFNLYKGGMRLKEICFAIYSSDEACSHENRLFDENSENFDAKKVILADYVREFGRRVDASGLENYANAYANGMGEQDIINELVNSDEWARKFIDDCCLAFVGRDCMENEFNNWYNSYTNGTPLFEVCDIIHSYKPETPTEDAPEETESQWYRVRATWENATSQVGAYHSLDGAKECADENGLNVYDESGTCVYPEPTFTAYMVGINVDELEGGYLNIRFNAEYREDNIVGRIEENMTVTIVDEINGWGKLMSGAGWISLDCTHGV